MRLCLRRSSKRLGCALTVMLGSCTFYNDTAQIPGGDTRLVVGNTGATPKIWVFDDARGLESVTIKKEK